MIFKETELVTIHPLFSYSTLAICEEPVVGYEQSVLISNDWIPAFAGMTNGLSAAGMTNDLSAY